MDLTARGAHSEECASGSVFNEVNTPPKCLERRNSSSQNLVRIRGNSRQSVANERGATDEALSLVWKAPEDGRNPVFVKVPSVAFRIEVVEMGLVPIAPPQQELKVATPFLEVNRLHATPAARAV